MTGSCFLSVLCGREKSLSLFMKIRPVFPLLPWGYPPYHLDTFAQIYPQNNAYIREKNREKMPCLTQDRSRRGRDMLEMPKIQERNVFWMSSHGVARTNITSYHCAISTISTARCSLMLYSPSKQRMGQSSIPSHSSCRRLLRMSNPPSSYDAAHTRNAWDDSYMSPPGRIRSPNLSCSR